MTQQDPSEEQQVDPNVAKLDDLDDIPLPQMITIPAGTFRMGTSKKQVMVLYEKEQWAQDWFEDGLFLVEQPQHKVTLPEYQIGLYPVTNEEYCRFIWESNYRVPKGWIGFRFGEKLDKHPVVGVSLEDCLAYCKWLSEITGKNYRLPSEAEWERAARGDEEPRVYPWGDDFDPWRCNTLESNKGGTTLVGSYSPAGDSAFGLADMSGNIWEWTSSRLLSYPFDPKQGLPDPKDKMRYVVKGGAWYYSRKLARCSSREGVMPEFVSPALGFRLACTL